MITVGLDFGTHQTKLCVEKKEGVECSYTFVKFKDDKSIDHYTIPSVINIDDHGLLSYGYIPPKTKGRIIRYFKQSVFRSTKDQLMSQEDAMYYSIWYLAYILFDLEKTYGTEFSVQMGVPTDSGHYENAKRIAVQILASAYNLVEEVFNNDKNEFLQCDVATLKKKTIIVDYTDEIKDNYGILVFPEAYACLKPLTSRGKIATGMSLMVDIGGGTTDVSFFTIENNLPQVYDFFSINKGLNYLTNVQPEDYKSLSSFETIHHSALNIFFNNIKVMFELDESNGNQNEGRKDSNVTSAKEIDSERTKNFVKELSSKCNNLIQKLQLEFQEQTNIPLYRLNDALKNRPLIYCGGGSTFRQLQMSYYGFQDKKLISHQEWDIKSIDDIDDIIKKGLCPILSTCYGLSISVATDNIKKLPFRDIFEDIRRMKEEEEAKELELYEARNRSTSTYDDWDTIK